MIKTFADKATEKFWVTGKSKGWPKATKRKLLLVDSAKEMRDLAALPGNRLEKLEGDRKGQYSIRINDQYRICFNWKDGDAYDVAVNKHYE
jgi:proteic killer suppression protein